MYTPYSPFIHIINQIFTQIRQGQGPVSGFTEDNQGNCLVIASRQRYWGKIYVETG